MIGKNLRVLMAQRKVNIQTMSDNTGLSRTTISNLTNDISKGIQFETITKLCSELKCSPQDLFRVDDKK